VPWFNARTQFHDGYDYTETPKKRISGLMAPGYLTLGPGFDIRAKKVQPVCFTSCTSFNPIYETVHIASTTRAGLSQMVHRKFLFHGITMLTLKDKFVSSLALWFHLNLKLRLQRI
jgi:hypothetical protein